MNDLMKNHDISAHKLFAEKLARIKRVKIAAFIIVLAVIIFLACITVQAIRKPVTITLTLNSAEITQGEPIPAFKVTAKCHGEKTGKILDKADNLTVKKLISQFHSGKNFTVVCDADSQIDNTYPAKIVFDRKFQKKLDSRLSSKLNLIVRNGQLTVKNRAGSWDGNKFKLNDGNYMTCDFLSSGGNTYYFDENGQMVTGERTIGLKSCVFDKDGRLTSKSDTLPIDPNRPMIALTYDDGPGERTNELLGILDKYNAHATFFMQGKNVSAHADTIQKMLAAGCELGNHTYNHPQLTKLTGPEVQKQIGDTNSLIQGACGQPASLLRPPYGAINDTTKANAGMPMILWTIDTLDWKTKDTPSIINAAISSAYDGAVILMHDIHSSTIDAAPAIISELTRQGYQLVTISELAAARGMSLENGNVYRTF